LELIDNGARDLDQADEGLTIYTSLADFQRMQDFCKTKGLKSASAEIEYVAKEKLSLSAEDQERANKFLEELGDNEDVSDYYTNLAN
jgi:transcriptional/translational regulatory protein YebC/TACO1